MNSHNAIRNAVRLALTAGVAASVMNAPAFAEEDEAARLERVEVTGSRIKRTDIETAQPVARIEREDIERTGLTSIGDLLQELPSAGSALNTNVNNGGDGSTSVDLRNLDARRVLVLVNGRRWVPNLLGQVDLNTIPISIIERVEVLKDGASAIYGSDAIAGVVNIITRKDYDGSEVSAYFGEFDEGDGTTDHYTFSIGNRGSRGSVFMNVGYVQQDPVMAGDREISKEPNFKAGVTVTGSSGTPQGRFVILTPTFANLNLTLTPGEDGADVSDFEPFTNAKRFNFAPLNYLLTPQERTNLYVQGHYDVTDNITFRSEVLYNLRESQQLLAPEPLFIGLAFASPTSNAGEIVIDATNPYNPFGFDLISNYYDWLDTYIAGNTQGLLILLGRRMLEVGPRIFNQEVHTWRFAAGFEGNLELANRYVDWDVNYMFTDNNQYDTAFGNLNMQRVEQALGPAADLDGDGDFECLDAGGAEIRGCVPLNLFGGQGTDVAAGDFQGVTGDGRGTITQEMIDWISFGSGLKDHFNYEIRNYTANASSEIADLPAGPLGLAVGYEYRDESGFDRPDALVQSGVSSGNARSTTAGGFTVEEFYAELAIPLLADVPFADRLGLSMALRSSDYAQDAGGGSSETTSKFGLEYEPFEDLLVRATKSEGFRAPSIFELFQGAADSFPDLEDPCDAANGARSPGNDVDQYCDDLGITDTFSQPNSQIRITQGGNPGNVDIDGDNVADIPALTPETADATTVGFVYSPGFVEGLDITVDWYRIELDNSIVRVGAQTVLNTCAETWDEASNQGTLCEFLTRDPALGFVTDIQNRFINFGGTETEGVDLNVSYRLPEFGFGRFKVTWDTTHVNDYVDFTFDRVTGEKLELERVGIEFGGGLVAFPRIKSNLDISWSMGDWEAAWQMRYIHEMWEACPTAINNLGLCSDPEGDDQVVIGGGPANHLGATTYHDVQVSYNMPGWDTKFTFGINNVFDKIPPTSYSAFANSYEPTLYEVPGMFTYLRVTKSF